VAKACAKNKELEETLHFLDGLRANPAAPRPAGRVLDFFQPVMGEDYPRRPGVRPG
jgi:hypothetical protein